MFQYSAEINLPLKISLNILIDKYLKNYIENSPLEKKSALKKIKICRYIFVAETLKEAEHPDFERMAPVPFSLVCFRYRPPHVTPDNLDALNRLLLSSINADGKFFLSDTILHGQVVLRVAIGNLRTTAGHLTRLWKLMTRFSL